MEDATLLMFPHIQFLGWAIMARGGAPRGEGDMGGVHLVAAEGRGGMGHLCESH